MSEYRENLEFNKPLDPSIERIRRRLLRLMIISIFVTILLVGGVLVTIIYELGQGWKKKNVSHSEIEGNTQYVNKIEEIVQKIIQEETKKLFEQFFSHENHLKKENVFDRRKILLSVDSSSEKLVSTTIKDNVLYLEFQSRNSSKLHPQKIQTKIIIYDIKGKNIVELVTSGLF